MLPVDHTKLAVTLLDEKNKPRKSIYKYGNCAYMCAHAYACSDVKRVPLKQCCATVRAAVMDMLWVYTVQQDSN